MAGNALAGLARAIGGRAERGMSNAKGSIFGVAEAAVRGQHAAEAQERNHQHTRQILKDVHKNAAEGTGVRVRVQSGEHEHDLGYIRGSNPTRNAKGYRENQPDHVGNAKELVAADKKPMLAIEGPKPKTETTFEAGSPNHSGSRSNEVTGVATGKRKTVDHSDAGSVDAHLSSEEAAHLAQRKAKQVNDVRQAGVGIQEKPSGNVALKAPAGSTGKNADIMFAGARNNNNRRTSEFQQKARQRAIDSGQIADNSKTVSPGTNSRTVRNPKANIQA